MVGTDNKPEFNVGIADNIQNIMEECSDFVWLMFFFGIIVGILLSWGFYAIYKCIKNKTSNTAIPFNEVTEVQEECDDIKENDEGETKWLIGFIIIIVLICAIAVGIAIGTSNKDDTNEEPTSEKEPEYRDAKNSDIITQVKNMTVTIQANEKIEGLVIEIEYLDKNKNVIKIEEVNIGKIAPGNTFQHKLTEYNMDFSNIGKLNSVRVSVIEGIIYE